MFTHTIIIFFLLIQSQKQEDWYEGQRLRDMGISIAKDEFFPKPKVEKKNETDGSIFYYPRANDPRKNCQNSIVTTKYSLMINSLATKYLDDAQLTHVARTSPHQQKNISMDQGNYSKYGYPENNMSVATKEFFSNNRLTK